MNKRIILSLFLAFSLTLMAQAQTSLTKGGLVFLTINSDSDDEFSFMLLENISNGTQIVFTDKGQKIDNTFRAGEGVLTWTADIALACGSEVVVNPTASTATSGTVAVVGTFDIDPAGDQIIALQGDPDAAFSNIAAIHTNGDWTTNAINENTSKVPTGLTDGTHCVAPNSGAGTAIASAIINCDILFGPNEIRTYVNSGSNFTMSTAAAVVGPASGCSDFDCNPDTEKPVIADCPSDMNPAIEPGCGANVTWTEPTFTDNSMNVTVTQSHSPPFFFGVGTTKVVYVGEDPSGNKDSCVFFVTVEQDNYAGEDSSKLTCRNGSVFFLSDHLAGNNITSGGSWFDEFNNPTTDQQDPATMSDGFYKYVVTSTNGCPDDEALVEVRLDYAPDKPVVTPNGTVNACVGDQVQLVSSSLFNNQWYKDGLILFGEINQDIIVTGNGDFHVVVTEDGCTSEPSDIAAVRFNPIVTIDSMDVTQVNCNDGNSGQIIVYASGGTPVLKYSIDGGITFQSNNTFSNLPPSTYQVVVKGIKGCRDEALAQTSDDDAVSITGSLIQNISCNNEDNGIVEGVGSGGSGNYFYTLHDLLGPLQVQGSGLFQGLPAGTYYITMQDISTGCKDTSQQITIENPAILELNATLVNGITCFNDNDAFITAAATGGTYPVEFSVDFGTSWGASGNFEDLSGGDYVVIARDAFGCTDTSDIFTIQNPLPIVIDSVEKENVSCFAADDGIIRIFAQGGTGLLYSIDNTTFSAGGEFLNLQPGTYDITVRDGNGCQEISTPITIGQPPRLRAFADVNQHVLCFGSNEGEITVSSTGGSGNVLYSMSTQPALQASPVFTDLVAGEYDVYVTDTKGCTDTVYGMTVHQPQRFTLVASVDSSILCFGDSMGAISVYANGGRGAIEYSLDGVNYSGAFNFDSLKGGNYNIRARDSAGCETNIAINLPEPALLEADLTGYDITCAGADDGRIRVNAEGGTIPYSFSIDSGLTWQNNANFYNLAEGTYGFLVLDNNGCMAITDSATIENPDTLFASVRINNHLSCFKANDGLFSVSVTGGRKPYLFSSDGLDFVPDSVFDNMASGSYQVTVIDSSGCTVVLDPLFLTQPNKLKVDTAVVTHVTCNGEVDGKITIVGSGGIPGLYRFSVDGVSFQFDNKFDSLFPGVYDVYIGDSSGCVSKPYSVEILEPEVLEATASIVNHVTCNGLFDGRISVQATGGTGVYEYSINNGGSWQSDSIFENIGGGNYSLLVRDVNDCEAITNSVVIVNPPLLSIVATLLEPISCRNANDAIITLQAFGGTGTYQFSLDGQNYAPNTSYSNLGPGTYTLYVKDQNGCVSIAPNIQITNPALLTMTVAVTNPISCPNGTDGKVTITPNGGSGVKLFSRNAVNYQQNPVFTGLGAGTHTFFTKDENGCVVSAQVTLSQPVPFLVTSTIKHEQLGNDGEIDVDVNNVITPITFEWSHDPNLNNDIASGLTAAIYTVKIIDGKGCFQIHSFEVQSKISIDETDPAGLLLYPNPTNGLVQIEFLGTWTDYAFDLVVLNNVGQVVHSERMYRDAVVKEADLSHLANGHYFLNIVGEKGNIQRPFIKQ